jgi:hypothetical protein
VRKLQGHQIALGALVATAFWAMVFALTSNANIIGLAFGKIGQSIDVISALITATATIAIARYTYTLKRSTDRLWDAGERQLSHLKESAEQQLGAYVGVSERQIISHDGGNTFVAEISIKNSGQTPAYQVKHCIDADVRDRLSRVAQTFPLSARLPQEWVMAPGATWKLVKDIAIGGPSGAGFIAKQRDIFAWGRVDYVDVFDKPQHLLFRFRSSERLMRVYNGTVMTTVGWELDPCEDGNTST